MRESGAVGLSYCSSREKMLEGVKYEKVSLDFWDKSGGINSTWEIKPERRQAKNVRRVVFGKTKITSGLYLLLLSQNASKTFRYFLQPMYVLLFYLLAFSFTILKNYFVHFSYFSGRREHEITNQLSIGKFFESIATGRIHKQNEFRLMQKLWRKKKSEKD